MCRQIKCLSKACCLPGAMKIGKAQRLLEFANISQDKNCFSWINWKASAKRAPNMVTKVIWYVLFFRRTDCVGSYTDSYLCEKYESSFAASLGPILL